MGLGFGASLPDDAWEMGSKRKQYPQNRQNKQSADNADRDAIEAEGDLSILLHTPDFSGLSCQMPAAKCPPVAQLKKTPNCLMVFKGRVNRSKKMSWARITQTEKKAPLPAKQTKINLKVFSFASANKICGMLRFTRPAAFLRKTGGKSGSWRNH